MRGYVALALALAACAGGGAPAPRSPEAVRLELAEDPTDGDLHRELAHALAAAGRPGGAMRHYEEARRRGDLEEGDRRALAELLARRAAARVALGDGEAWRDAERAAGMGRPVDARVVREAQLLGALAGFRRGDGPGRARGVEMLERALRRQPRDFRHVLLDAKASGADPMSLARAAAWLEDGGARRVALETYQRYVDRGGRVAEHVRRYLALHRWWYGDTEKPSGLLMADAMAAGIAEEASQINHQDTKNTKNRKNNLGGLGVLVVHPQGVDRIRKAYARDPAAADRMAEEWIDGVVALGERAPAIIELYRELGDPARAWRWAEKLMTSSPRHAPYLMLAGETSAAAGDPARAEVFFVQAAAASGDAGQSCIAAARAFLDVRQHLPAATAARRAIQLTGRGTAEHAAAIELAAVALERLGRADDAAALRARLPRQ